VSIKNSSWLKISLFYLKGEVNFTILQWR